MLACIRLHFEKILNAQESATFTQFSFETTYSLDEEMSILLSVAPIY